MFLASVTELGLPCGGNEGAPPTATQEHTMLTPAETARLAKLTSRLERTVTDDLDLDLSLIHI